MTYIDKCKEEIGWLKAVFAISTATDISLIAWVIQNYGKAMPILLMIGTFGGPFTYCPHYLGQSRCISKN